MTVDAYLPDPTWEEIGCLSRIHPTGPRSDGSRVIWPKARDQALHHDNLRRIGFPRLKYRNRVEERAVVGASLGLAGSRAVVGREDGTTFQTQDSAKPTFPVFVAIGLPDPDDNQRAISYLTKKSVSGLLRWEAHVALLGWRETPKRAQPDLITADRLRRCHHHEALSFLAVVLVYISKSFSSRSVSLRKRRPM